MLKLTLLLGFSLALFSAMADEPPSSAVSKPTASDFSTRPKIEISVSAEGVFSINDIPFSEKQIVVLLGQLEVIQPEIVLRICAGVEVKYKYVNRLVELALENGIIDFLISINKEAAEEEEKEPKQRHNGSKLESE